MDIDLDEFYKYYNVENHTIDETLKHFNMKYSFFRKFVVEHNFKKNIKATGIKHKIPSKEEIIKYYITDNKTAEELAKYYNINIRTFQRWTKKYNIVKPINNKLENMYNTNIEKYGSKTIFGTKKYRQWFKDNYDDISKKIKKTMNEKYGSKSYVESNEAKQIWKLGTSKTEERIYQKLKSIYSDCINGYKSSNYPYNCDFYIPCLDLYIEYQGFYTHGEEPFDRNNINHIHQVEMLKENKSEYNVSKLHVWTEKDVSKRNTAFNNNLKWIEFFTEEEFNKWFYKINKNNVIYWIESIYKNVIKNYNIDGIKVDLFYPTKKIAIKLRGLFWDLDKTNPKKESMYLKEKGIRLINIYDYEWFNYEDNFKEFIKNILKSRNKKLLKNNVIVQITSEEMVNFLKNNHLFSDTIKGCTYCYGIYQDGELIAVSGFNKLSKKYDYEWKRFGIKYGWMTEKNIAKLFLDNFSLTHKGLLVDYQQMDRFPFSTDENMGFKYVRWNNGSVSVSNDMKFTRHTFISEKGLNKVDTMKKYGYHYEYPTAGTITWVKEL